MFQQYFFEGSYREVGRQYGEQFRNDLVEWNERQHKALSDQFDISDALTSEMIFSYEKICKQYAPGLVEQLLGMAEGANITFEDAMLFQVNAEIGNELKNQVPECTSFVIPSEYTSNGKSYSGQNADMWPSYADKCSVVTFAVTGKPRITYLLPIGYLSYHGMNSEGISCNHNALFGSTWKKGLPRFFVSRMALECNSLHEIKQFIDGIDYIASRHTLFADRDGNTISYEFDSKHTGVTTCSGKAFVHTNHYLCSEMLKYETISTEDHCNSEMRLNQMKALIEKLKGQISVEEIKTMLRNHENGENSICVHGFKDKIYTFASIINCLCDGKILIARGNPCESDYVSYSV